MVIVRLPAHHMTENRFILSSPDGLPCPEGIHCASAATHAMISGASLQARAPYFALPSVPIEMHN
jgi:malate synthase